MGGSTTSGHALDGCFPGTPRRLYDPAHLESLGLGQKDVELLAQLGLPEQVVPFFRADEIRPLEKDSSESGGVAIGGSVADPSATFVLSTGDGHVSYVQAGHDDFEVFVNSRLDRFRYFLCRMPTTSDGLSCGSIMELRRELLTVDATALLDEESFWSAVLLELEAGLF